MNMAVLLLANIDLEEWFAQLTAELKKRKAGLDLRIWPESGKLVGLKQKSTPNEA
ncbi:hypothetical protein [Moorena producens]|nr:hypothetical protein [Moorena producens]